MYKPDTHPAMLKFAFLRFNNIWKCLFLLIVSCFGGSLLLHAQLQADFTPDKAGGCSPLTVAFTNTTRGASAGAVYSWDLGNGNTSALKDPGAIYRDEISYPVKLTVTDGGKTSVKIINITVYKKPIADFTAVAAKVCLPASASFNNTSLPGDGSISSCTWDFGNGTTQQTGPGQVSYFFKDIQQATVNLVVTNNYGCVSTVTKSNIVEILPEMKPAFKADKTLLCKTGEVVTFKNTSNGPGTLQYEWNFGDGGVGNVQNPAHVYNTKNLYVATLKISNQYGCQASVSSGQINVAYFNTDFNTSMLCREASFNASSYSGLYVSAALWDFGDNTSANTSYNAKKVYATEGSYTVKLVNTYNNICNDTVTKVIDVKDKVNYNTVINVPAAACIGSGVYFNSSSSVNPSSRSWSFGNGATDNYSSSPYYNYPLPGTYTVKLVNTFGTCQEEVTKSIVINALPDIKPFDINLGGLCGAPVTVTFKDNTTDAVSWSWRINYEYSGPGGSIVFVPSALKSPSFDYTRDGAYNIDLTVKNAAGCQAYTARQVYITRPSVSIYPVSTEYPGGVRQCDDVKMKFGFNSSEAVTDFKWNFGGGNTSTDKEPVFTFTNPGITSISISYTTINGCKGTASYNSAEVYKKPKTDFTYSVPPCEDKVVVNLSSSSSPYTAAAWDYGSGYGYEGRSTTHVYQDTGRYIVKHIGFNGGCSDTIVKEIYANVPPKFIRITSVTPQQCTGTRGEITFNQTSLRATGLSWNFGDGTIIPYDTSVHKITHTYTKTGSYNVLLTANSGGCPLQQAVFPTILLKQHPVLSADLASICSNQGINVVITGLETNPYTNNYYYDLENYQYGLYRFEYEDGTPLTGFVSGSFKYTNYAGYLTGLKSGDIRIRAIIRNNYIGCYDTTNLVSIKVNGPQAALKITNNNVCWKTPVVFEDASTAPTNTPIVSWQWYYGDGAGDLKSASAKVTHSYVNPGTYTASLTVTDAAGCRSTAYSTPEYVQVRGPKVAFTPSGLYVPNVPLNTTITFNNNTNTGNVANINYTWDYGNGVAGNTFTGLQTYPKAGNYTIKLTATDPLTGCSDAATTPITVRDFNTGFEFSTNYLGAGSCLPVQLRITRNTSVNATSYAWDFGDGFRVEGPSAPSHTYTTPGKKVITLYSKGYNDLNGIYRDSIMIEESSAVMKADILKGCTGQQVLFDAQALNTSAYVWDMGDGTLKQTTSEAFFKHTYLSPGIFTPKVIVKDARGCGNTAGITEKIIIDSLNVSLSALLQHLCQYNDNEFIPAVYSLAESYAGEKITYKWDYGTGNSADESFGKEGAFTYNNHGSYIVKLKVTSPYGCYKEDSKKVEVHEKLGLKIKAPSTVDICEKSSAVITVTGAASYEWINNTDGLSNTNTGNPTLTPAIDGTYTVVGYDEWKCSSDQAEIKVIVRPLPTVNAGPDALVVANTEQQLFATASSNVTQYLWTPSTYLDCKSCATPIVKPKKSTNYIIKVKTAYDCVASDTILVKLQCLNGYIYIPNTFTPNRDGKNELFYIKGKGIGIIRSLRVFNRWGDMMFERKNFEIDDPAAGWNGYKNGQPVPAGAYVYIAEMQCEEGDDTIIKKGSLMVLY